VALPFGSAFDLVDKYILGYALGVAAGPALRPFVQDLANEAWTLNQDAPLAAGIAAAIAAENVDQYDAMATEATLTGIDAKRFADLYGVTLSAPGTGELLQALRRATITPDDFTHGLRKTKLETRWDAALADLQHVRLTPEQIALGIVRSVVPDPGLLAVTLDTSGGIVTAYPEWPGDVLAEARAGGYDPDRLRVLVGEVGLPMSAQQAASAYFRSIIKLPDYNRAILEGDTRPEWAPYILDQARQILTASQYVEGHLRGWIDEAAMLAGAAKHGMSVADTNLLFELSGRPIPVHQVTTGLARGGVFNGPIDAIELPYLRSLQEGNERPEWYNLSHANRYSLPSPFVMRSLTQTKVWTEAKAHTRLLEAGWIPEDAAEAAAAWAGGTTSSADPHVSKADTQLWSTVHASYKAEESTAADVAPALTLLGLDGATQTEVLARWDAERALIRKQLSPAQIKKALGSGVNNPATGVPWTFQEGIDALVARGYTVADATVILQE
jgi:hypothetical protein